MRMAVRDLCFAAREAQQGLAHRPLSVHADFTLSRVYGARHA
jgi:hypothetical protein